MHQAPKLQGPAGPAKASITIMSTGTKDVFKKEDGKYFMFDRSTKTWKELDLEYDRAYIAFIEGKLPPGLLSEGFLRSGFGFDVPAEKKLVRDLQIYCNMAGFNCGPVDGDFGGLTAAGIKRLQEYAAEKLAAEKKWTDGFPIDAIVGPKTEAMISELLEKGHGKTAGDDDSELTKAAKAIVVRKVSIEELGKAVVASAPSQKSDDTTPAQSEAEKQASLDPLSDDASRQGPEVKTASIAPIIAAPVDDTEQKFSGHSMVGMLDSEVAAHEICESTPGCDSSKLELVRPTNIKCESGSGSCLMTRDAFERVAKAAVDLEGEGYEVRYFSGVRTKAAQDRIAYNAGERHCGAKGSVCDALLTWVGVYSPTGPHMNGAVDIRLYDKSTRKQASLDNGAVWETFSNVMRKQGMVNYAPERWHWEPPTTVRGQRCTKAGEWKCD